MMDTRNGPPSGQSRPACRVGRTDITESGLLQGQRHPQRLAPRPTIASTLTAGRLTSCSHESVTVDVAGALQIQQGQEPSDPCYESETTTPRSDPKKPLSTVAVLESNDVFQLGRARFQHH